MFEIINEIKTDAQDYYLHWIHHPDGVPMFLTKEDYDNNNYVLIFPAPKRFILFHCYYHAIRDLVLYKWIGFPVPDATEHYYHINGVGNKDD